MIDIRKELEEKVLAWMGKWDVTLPKGGFKEVVDMLLALRTVAAPIAQAAVPAVTVEAALGALSEWTDADRLRLGEAMKDVFPKATAPTEPNSFAALILENQQAGFDRCFEALEITDDTERGWSSLVLEIRKMKRKSDIADKLVPLKAIALLAGYAHFAKEPAVSKASYEIHQYLGIKVLGHPGESCSATVKSHLAKVEAALDSLTGAAVPAEQGGESVCIAISDSREAFEAWAETEGFDLIRHANEAYATQECADAWLGWQASITHKDKSDGYGNATILKCAEIADRYTCGTCGMDGKCAAEIRGLLDDLSTDNPLVCNLCGAHRNFPDDLAEVFPPSEHDNRYRVEKAIGGFWPYVVRCGTGTRELFKGHLKQCERFRAELVTAFRDGYHVAHHPSRDSAPAQQDGETVLTYDRIDEIWKMANGEHLDNNEFGAMVVRFAHALLAAPAPHSGEAAPFVPSAVSTAGKPCNPSIPADQIIEYQYECGTLWCDLGPAERMRSDFKGIYRLKAGAYPVARIGGAGEVVAEPVHNPWRESLENCISGDNYLRAQEYRDLIAELDALYAAQPQAVPSAAITALKHDNDRLMDSVSGEAAEVDQLKEQFDMLAAAIGWTKERCEQTGDSPFDVAAELVKRPQATQSGLSEAEINDAWEKFPSTQIYIEAKRRGKDGAATMRLAFARKILALAAAQQANGSA